MKTTCLDMTSRPAKLWPDLLLLLVLGGCLEVPPPPGEATAAGAPGGTAITVDPSVPSASDALGREASAPDEPAPTF